MGIPQDLGEEVNIGQSAIAPRRRYGLQNPAFEIAERPGASVLDDADLRHAAR